MTSKKNRPTPAVIGMRVANKISPTKIEKTLLKETIYSAGYVVRDEVWRFGSDDSYPTNMRSAYTPNGDYIGDLNWARRLIKERGIIPQKISPDSNVCSIGYSPKEKKWYGWSHRAICGFKVGDKVKKGTCTAEYLPVGFTAKNIDDMKAMAVAFARSVS